MVDVIKTLDIKYLPSNPASSFRALHAQRLPSYQLADFRVDSSREPAAVVADILRLGIFPSADPNTHLLVEEPKT